MDTALEQWWTLLGLKAGKRWNQEETRSPFRILNLSTIAPHLVGLAQDWARLIVYAEAMLWDP